ncbi:NAD(P)-dependent oxidoreductase [Halogeometricum limi]|uniref:2-hydroxy-3-oxopropionate reductase n=1 Tax=Halogeometricum limi TaxID=555875 RepID=A0A1I6IC39_9EURY|nr:NAD(P)-dependent oxidoreductase [Halogeometricum limi]SFR64302.1 2-hydroxy-3-oxopropionate reductase [Halogeometricum limi]
MLPRVGIVGAGRMGSRMGTNLLDAGYELTVFDLDEERVDALVQRGATGATSASDVAAQSDVVLTSLPHTEAVEETYLGDDGLVFAAREGSVLMETSTVVPEAIEAIDEALADRDVEFVDAPVIGTPVEAAAATLTIVVGSTAAAFDRVDDLLATLGDRVEHVGRPGQGKRLKLANNVMTYGNFAIAAEMFAVVSRLGIDPELFFDVTQSGVAQAAIVETKAPKLFERDFTPGFTFEGVLKDLRYCLDMKTETGVATPLASTVVEQYVLGARVAGPETDYAALVDALTDLDVEV